MKKTRHSRSGFTLIEVVIGMALLALLIGGAYQIVLSVADAAAEIRRQQTRREGVTAMIDSLRWMFRRMPANVQISLFKSAEAKDNPGLAIRNDPSHPFTSSPLPPDAGIVLMIEKQRGGLSELCRYVSKPAPSGVEAPPLVEESRLVLLRDVRSAAWSTFDASKNEWSPDFPADGSRPRLLRWSLLLGEESAERHIVFGIAPQPAQAPAGAPADQPPTEIP